MNVLTNEELRLAIAKVKGWKFKRLMGLYATKWLYPTLDGSVPDIEGYGFKMEFVDDPVIEDITWPDFEFSDLKDWSTDISAAWELVEEMRPSFFQILLMCWDHTDKWNVQYNPRHGHDEIVNHPSFEADTAPRAICLAWLAWKEAQK